jgi:hypothetical protein
VDPAGIAVPGDLHADEPAEGLPVDAAIAVPDHGPVDLVGDDQEQRADRGLQRLLDLDRVEQPERDVEGLAEASVGVVADLPACITTRTRSGCGRLAL